MKKIPIFAVLIIMILSCDQATDIPLFKENKVKNVCIQPFGDIDTAHINEVYQAIIAHYEFNVKILKPIDHPKNAYTTKRSPRYRADTLIRYLRDIKPDQYDYIMGLTKQDISITKYTGEKAQKKIKDPEWKYCDFGIYGLGFRPGPSCIISTFRLYAHGINEKTMRGRLRKISVHELGHNLGLPHCPDTECLMQDACEKMSTIDQAKEALCTKCKQQLQ